MAILQSKQLKVYKAKAISWSWILSNDRAHYRIAKTHKSGEWKRWVQEVHNLLTLLMSSSQTRGEKPVRRNSKRKPFQYKIDNISNLSKLQIDNFWPLLDSDLALWRRAPSNYINKKALSVYWGVIRSQDYFFISQIQYQCSRPRMVLNMEKNISLNDELMLFNSPCGARYAPLC